MCWTFDCSLALVHAHARLRLPRGRVTMSVPRISNNSFWGFGSASVSRFTNFLDFNFMFNSAFNQLRVPLQLRRLLRWSSIGAREGFCLLCLLSLEPWINKNFFKGQGQQVVWRVACVVRRWGLWWLVVVVCGAAWRRPRPARGKGCAVMSPAGCCHWPPR